MVICIDDGDATTINSTAPLDLSGLSHDDDFGWAGQQIDETVTDDDGEEDDDRQ